MYDYDGNGVLDQNDFECLAVRNTILEGKGTWCPDKYETNKKVNMLSECLMSWKNITICLKLFLGYDQSMATNL